MRRTLLPVVALVFAAAPVASVAAQAKAMPYLGLGLVNGTGDFGTYTETGWIVFGGINWPIASTPGLAVGVNVIYGHVPHEGGQNEATNIPGVFGEVAYTFSAASASNVKPYVEGGVGLIQHRYSSGDTGYGSDSETKFGFAGGAGLSFLMKSSTLFLGGHLINASDTSLLSFYVALGFGGGTGK